MPKMNCATGLLVVALLLVGAGPRALANEKLNVYTVNYPLTYFAERIAGDLATVSFPAPPDVDPAFWLPDPETIAAFQAADLILLNGADYAKWTAKVSLPRSRLVDTSRGFRDAYLQATEGVTHSHGPGGEHSHAGTAFTTWVDFTQALVQASAVRDALSRWVPAQAEIFAANFAALEHELRDLDARLAAIVAHDPAKPLFASHPVYQYLARRYALNLKSVMWEPDALAPESEWWALAELRQRHPAAWMVWEREPTAENRERLQQLGIQSTVFDPCGNRPETGDFLSVMSTNVANMARVFGGKPNAAPR